MEDLDTLARDVTLLRCPYCMSQVALAGRGTISCRECRRSYSYVDTAGGQVILGLRRDDALAILAQDVVVNRQDPASARRDVRWRVRRIEEREGFLNPLMRRTADPYAIAARRQNTPPSTGTTYIDAGRTGTTWQVDALHRFVHLLPPPATVLDLGCGEGAWTMRLSGDGCHAVGLDASGPSLRRAAETLAGAGTRAMLIEGDMMEMPFASAAFDGIWCSDAFRYARVDRRTVLFRQMNRVLRMGGVLCLGTLAAPVNDVLHEYVRWRVLRRKPVVPGEYIERLPPSLGHSWHYQAVASAYALHRLCGEHGFRVLLLRHTGDHYVLLARKVRGTDAAS